MLQPSEAARPLTFEDLRQPGFNWLNALLIIVLLGLFGLSAQQTHFSLLEPFTPENTKSVVRFVGGLFPPELDPAFLRTIGGLLLETIEISIVGTALAIALGLPLGLLAMHQRGEESSREALGTPAWALRWAAYGLSRAALNVARA